MRPKTSNQNIALGLFAAIFLWGANNAATKHIIKFWPPITVGTVRFLAAGMILLGLLRWTRLLGAPSPINAATKKRLWFQAGVSLAVYIACFTLAIYYTSASHVALYLGASPVWALLWERRPKFDLISAQKYGAAALALAGVVVLFLPTLSQGGSSWLGELFGLGCSIMWTSYGRQCRHLGQNLAPAEVAGCTFWRAAVLLSPFCVFELLIRPPTWRTDIVLLQIYCIIGSGVIAFMLWNNALRHWPTSKVYLFNNLIPLSTMIWANICLNEPISSTFWIAMSLIVAGVILGQTNWSKVLGSRWLPAE